jgi:hypothetical protein
VTIQILLCHKWHQLRRRFRKQQDIAARFTRNRPSRQPFPEHLPRERVVVPGLIAWSLLRRTEDELAAEKAAVFPPWRGITSSDSVTVSPSFLRRVPPS